MIGDYFDVVPRATAKVETLGGLHVFDPSGLGTYASRPTLDREMPVTVDDISNATERMREREVPVFFEWVEDRAPDMSVAAEAAGLRVGRYPLMVLTGDPHPVEVDDVIIGPVLADDVDRFLAVRHAVNIGFIAGGTEVGDDPHSGTDD